MNKSYFMQIFCITLMLMLATPTFAQKKSSKGKKANPYATVPSSLMSIVYNLSKKEATICVNRDYAKKFSFCFDRDVSMK